MSPDKKLDWFRQRRSLSATGEILFSEQKIQEIRQKVIQRWNDTYRSSRSSTSTPSTLSAQSSISSIESSSLDGSFTRTLASKPPIQKGSRWLEGLTTAASVQPSKIPPDIDDIEAYLNEPVVPEEVVRNAGGVMKYWHLLETSRPRLAQMGADYCSAPGSHFYASLPQCLV